MKQANPVWQQIAEAIVRKAVDDELRHDMQIGARVDPMGNAGAQDRENGGRTLATEIAVREEPVLPSEDEGSQLALEAVVRELDSPIGEEQDQAVPLKRSMAAPMLRPSVCGGRSTPERP